MQVFASYYTLPPFITASTCTVFPSSSILPFTWILCLCKKVVWLISRECLTHYQLKKNTNKHILHSLHTQSAGSPEFPFRSLWFSSLVLLSFVRGSKSAAADRSGSSVQRRKEIQSEKLQLSVQEEGMRNQNVPGNLLSMKKTTKLTVYLKHKRGSWVSLRPQELNEKNRQW